MSSSAPSVASNRRSTRASVRSVVMVTSRLLGQGSRPWEPARAALRLAYGAVTELPWQGTSGRQPAERRQPLKRRRDLLAIPVGQVARRVGDLHLRLHARGIPLGDQSPPEADAVSQARHHDPAAGERLLPLLERDAGVVA